MVQNRRIIKTLLKFRYAFQGITVAFKTQNSFRFHVFAGIMIYILGFLARLTLIEWAFISTAVIFVIVAELFNTAIEHICNYIQPRFHKMIKIIKDIAAGAVLISVTNSIIVGCMVFIPHIMRLLNG